MRKRPRKHEEVDMHEERCQRQNVRMQVRAQHKWGETLKQVQVKEESGKKVKKLERL